MGLAIYLHSPLKHKGCPGGLKGMNKYSLVFVCKVDKFKKMNTANSPPWRGAGVGQYKNTIHFFEFTNIMDSH